MGRCVTAPRLDFPPTSATLQAARTSDDRPNQTVARAEVGRPFGPSRVEGEGLRPGCSVGRTRDLVSRPDLCLRARAALRRGCFLGNLVPGQWLIGRNWCTVPAQ